MVRYGKKPACSFRRKWALGREELARSRPGPDGVVVRGGRRAANPSARRGARRATSVRRCLRAPLRAAGILAAVCSRNATNSHVAALNRRWQLCSGRVHLRKRLAVQGAPPISPYTSAPICQVSAHVLVTGASCAATGSSQLRARRFLHLLATSAYRREALEQLRAMSGMRALEHAALRARARTETAAALLGACSPGAGS